MKNKRIYLNRAAIASIGDPTHLNIRYDEQDGVLFFSPTVPDDLDAYEIPNCFWTDIGKTCEIARIAFLKALQYRLGWEAGSMYYYEGRIIEIDNMPTLVYTLAEGVRMR